MDPVQFEPKIATDLQANWRRPNTGSGTDVFTDLLADHMKRRAEADQQDLDARRREASRSQREGSDPVSGRPPRVAVAHPKTLRGEAKEVDQSGERHLPARTDAAPDDNGAKGAGDQTADGSKAEGSKGDGSKADTKGKAAKAKAKTDAAEGVDQAAQPTPGQQPAPDPSATTLVAVQAGSSPKAADTGKAPASAALALPAPVPSGQPAVSPTPAKAGGADKVAAGDHPAASDGAPKQAPIEAAAAAALSEPLAALDTGKAEPANAANPSAGAP